MGRPFLAFTVETFDSYHHGAHRLADFSRLQTAIRAAKDALTDSRVTLAVVKDRDGVVRFCADPGREWTDSHETGLQEPAETDSFESSRPVEPDIEAEPDLSEYRRHMLVLAVCFLAAAWVEVPPL